MNRATPVQLKNAGNASVNSIKCMTVKTTTYDQTIPDFTSAGRSIFEGLPDADGSVLATGVVVVDMKLKRSNTVQMGIGWAVSIQIGSPDGE